MNGLVHLGCLLGLASVASAWQPSIWPLPTRYSNGTATLGLGSKAGTNGFFSMASAPVPAILEQAFERYAKISFPHATSGSEGADAAGTVSGLVVKVEHPEEPYPQLDTNESYSLAVGADGTATLSASTVYGALHGLETFSQMVSFNFDTKAYELAGAPWSIEDAPRFAHRGALPSRHALRSFPRRGRARFFFPFWKCLPHCRGAGLMIDTSRHFETLPTLRRMVDSLAFAKVNVLHGAGLNEMAQRGRGRSGL